MHPLFIPLFGYIALFIVVGGIGMYVANRSVDAETRGQRWFKFFTYIGIVTGIIASIMVGHFYLIAILIAAIGLGEVIHIMNRSLPLWFWLLTGGLYIGITAGFITFALVFERSFLLFIYFQVFIFDGFSQVVGQLIGKQQLLPQISPNKTLEGLMGGTLFCLISAILTRDWVAIPPATAVLLGLTTAFLAFTGDGLASYLKRRCQVKDYSNLLRGHGGFLDRFDSLMMAGMGYGLLSQIHLLP